MFLLRGILRGIEQGPTTARTHLESVVGNVWLSSQAPKMARECSADPNLAFSTVSRLKLYRNIWRRSTGWSSSMGECSVTMTASSHLLPAENMVMVL